jgi:hypothetical protein
MSFRFPRLAAAALAASLCGVATAGTSYQFFFAKDLAVHAEQNVGKGVKVVDELCKIWESQDVPGYIRFDTKYFRCAVPDTETESIAYLREVEKKHSAKESSIPPLVAVYGTLGREPLFGPVKGGAGAGVASEQILIKVDKVEKPRDRFWEEGN